MSASFFQFRQFTLWHDRCAMKVGTDGVLLGAWAPVDGCYRMLDVGTGSGVIALQLAQRTEGYSDVRITAVEIEADAARQASENVLRSRWQDRVEVLQTDFLSYSPEEAFDLIVSNPPYFSNALKNPDQKRSMARHTGTLDYESLISRSAAMLSAAGRLCLIIPVEVLNGVEAAAERCRLRVMRRTNVYTKVGKPCRRVLLCLCKEDYYFSHADQFSQENLYIMNLDGDYTNAYRELVSAFYLDFI